MADAFNLARAGRLNYSIALSLTGYMRNEVDYIPWKSMETALRFFDTMLSRTRAYGDFRVSMQRFIVLPLKKIID